MAASADMHGAPVSPVEPPMMKTLPEENFVELALRRGMSRSTPAPISPASGRAGPPRGMPMSTTSMSPAYSLPGRTHRPTLARWNVAVATQCTAAPATSPVEASIPDGTSQATTGARAASISSITLSAGSRGAPEEPVPSSASTITWARFSRAASKCTGPSPGSFASCFCASSPIQSGGHTTSTSTSRPAWRRWRAATIPSPPLLPLPQTIAIRPAGARRDTRSASPSPACSISSSEAISFSDIAQRSSSRVSPASSRGSIQRGSLIAAKTTRRDGGYAVATRNPRTASAMAMISAAAKIATAC